MFSAETLDAADSILDVIEQCLVSAEWSSERSDDVTLHCAAPTRWGECGGVFAWREDPAAIHFTLSVEMRAPKSRHIDLVQLLALVNERLWLGHFEYWTADGVIMFRHTIPMQERANPEPGEIHAVIGAATDAIERFLPAFNFTAWAGRSPDDAIQSALFDTVGEA